MSEYRWLQCAASTLTCVSHGLIAYHTYIQQGVNSIPGAVICVLISGSMCWLVYATLIGNYFLVASSSTSVMIYSLSMVKRKIIDMRATRLQIKFSVSDDSLPQSSPCP